MGFKGGTAACPFAIPPLFLRLGDVWMDGEDGKDDDDDEVAGQIQGGHQWRGTATWEPQGMGWREASGMIAAGGHDTAAGAAKMLMIKGEGGEGEGGGRC